MGKQLNLRPRRWKRQAAIIIFSVALTTAGIKASEFFSSPNNDSGENGPCPVGMAFVSAPGAGFCIDVYEASAGENCLHTDPGGQAETRENLDISACQPISKPQAKPWRYVSQNQAALACAKAGKHLPTNKEWQLAALGTPDKAANWEIDDCNVNKNWRVEPGLTGSGKNCVSAAGAYDMIGNVWEWIDGTVTDGQYQGHQLPLNGYVFEIDDSDMPSVTDPSRPDQNHYLDFFWLKDKGTRGLARGGYWDNGSDAGQYAVYAVTPPSYVGVGVGFRCAK